LEKKLPLINMALIGIILLSLAGGVHIWLNPKHPSRVDGTAIQPAPRPLEKPVLTRKPAPAQVAHEVAQRNVFRKERREFTPKGTPQVIGQLARATHQLPPPKLSLQGVVLVNGTKVALFNGSYPVREANNKVQDKPLKHKGYRIGENIGGYHINTIDKHSVTMKNASGGILTLNVSKRTEGQKIQRNGNNFVHKDPTAREKREQDFKELQAAIKLPKKDQIPKIKIPPELKNLPRVPVRKPNPRLMKKPPIRTVPPKVSISGAQIPPSRVQ
jgi:hypothetical protein